MRIKKNILVIPLFFLLTILTVPLLVFFSSYQNKIYPNVWVGNIDLGGKTLNEAKMTLNGVYFQEITLAANSQPFNIQLSEINFKFDAAINIEQAFSVGRNKRPLRNILEIFNLRKTKKIFPFKYSIDENKLRQFLSDYGGQIAVEPIAPSTKITSGEVVINRGKDGLDIDLESVYQSILESLSYGYNQPITVSLTPRNSSLNEAEFLSLSSHANSLIGKSINLTYENFTFALQDNDLVAFLGPRGGYDQSSLDKKIEELSLGVNREPQNPVFVYEDNRVKEFSPSRNGLEIKKDQFRSLIIENLSKLLSSDEKKLLVEIPVTTTAPDINTSEVNNLGIVELIGKGTSRFKGSIPSRVYNVNLAASRINGRLVKPGEVFSFNAALGDVSKLTGYKEAYVIKDGKTVLGDGGGVCQVSTTLFRAVLNAGLPINERRAHAYRVYYYEQDSGPGLDATVYSPTTDFKFKNDTPGHILIQAKADTKNLTLEFELYGTNDGRVSTVSKPTTTQVTDPGDDIYQDDPTLPAGVVKQTEHKAWGAKVIFNYSVKRGEKIIYQKQFVSNYRPWPAVYLRGTGPVQ